MSSSVKKSNNTTSIIANKTNSKVVTVVKESEKDKQYREKRIQMKKEYESLPWIEKHRPAKIQNVKVDQQIKVQIEKMINGMDLPNIILEGPPGVGKTSTIKCVARELYKRYYSNMVLEMNASDDRGISIQESIENFRKSYVHIDTADKGSVPKFKMVILDEADNMTDKAKHIISSFIKSTTSDLRFAFTCNIKDNISPSIQSGCHIVKYPPLTDEIIQGRLMEISKLEGIVTDTTTTQQLKNIEKGIEAITRITNGDMRCAINMLQLTYNRYGDISRDMVFSIHDKPHPQKSKDIIIDCLEGRLDKALSKIRDMKNRGYSGMDICLGLCLALRLDICDDIPDEVKIEMWKHISYASYNISKGLDSSLLQIEALVAEIYRGVKNMKLKQ